MAPLLKIQNLNFSYGEVQALHDVEMEVPEISEGIVQIRAIAREAGDRAKVAVEAMDETIDAVGACSGAASQRSYPSFCDCAVDNWAICYFSALFGARKLVGAGLHASCVVAQFSQPGKPNLRDVNVLSWLAAIPATIVAAVTRRYSPAVCGLC